MAIPTHSFTTTFDKVTPVLQTDVVVHSQGETKDKKKFVAIWDTGATGTCITSKVAQLLGLKPSGITKSLGVHGEQFANTFIVDITLPNRVTVPKVKVVEVKLTPGSDVLIGMNIIALGDFALTHNGGKTIMTFRVPSVDSIDFVKEDRVKQIKAKVKRTTGNKPTNITPPKKKRKNKGKKKR